MNIFRSFESTGLRQSQAESFYPVIGLHIDGEWIHERERRLEIHNPSNDQLLGYIPCAEATDLERALSSAKQAFKTWRDTPSDARAFILRRARTLLLDRTEEIAHAITLDQGKPLADARAEVGRAGSFLEWDAEQSLRVYGNVLPPAPQFQRKVLKEPIGPVAAFTPWNVPISSPARKISGALAAGCSVIIKAAEDTPAAAVALVQCFVDAGLPKGVLQLVFGDPAFISSTLIRSPIIRMITLTGSVRVGKHLAGLAGEAMKPALMELGGHAPVIVGKGVNPVTVAKLACTSKMRMAGQICASPTRFLVHQSIYEAFVSAFADAVNQLQVGDGFAEGVQMGPLINQQRVNAIHEMVRDASERGARIVAGGKRLYEQGNFYAPTIIADLPLDSLAMTQEPFGPLALCNPYESLDDALEIANSLPFGLSAYAFTNSLAEAERIERELECGNLSINHFGAPGADAPFGGVKDSGMGREGGAYGLDAYMVSKTVLLKTCAV